MQTPPTPPANRPDPNRIMQELWDYLGLITSNERRATIMDYVRRILAASKP